MSRTVINFLLDVALLTAFVALAATAVIIRFIFPVGTQADHWMLWGYGYDAWVGMLFNMLAVLALGILVHVMLHWNWVCGVVGSRLSKWRGRTVRIDEANQTIYGVGLLVVLFTLMGLTVGVAALSISSGAESPPPAPITSTGR